MFVKQIGIRRLLALVIGLPSDSATFRVDMHRQWTVRDEAFARALEVMDSRLRHVAAHYTDKQHRRAWQPLQVFRPGDEQVVATKKNITTDPNEIAAFFARHGK